MLQIQLYYTNSLATLLTLFDRHANLKYYLRESIPYLYETLTKKRGRNGIYRCVLVALAGADGGFHRICLV